MYTSICLFHCLDQNTFEGLDSNKFWPKDISANAHDFDLNDQFNLKNIVVKLLVELCKKLKAHNIL
jgi:hypothetical protein